MTALTKQIHCLGVGWPGAKKEDWNPAPFKVVCRRENFSKAPVAEATCPLSEPHHPTTRSPNCRVSSPSRCVPQTLCEITNWKGKPRRHKLSKDYIGGPSNFKHLCHVGWSPQTGFATSFDPELKMIFAMAGITQDHLKDRRTSKKILEVIEKCGGVEAVLKEAKMTALNPYVDLETVKIKKSVFGMYGLLKKPLDHPLLYPAMPTELGSTCSPNNKQDSRSLGVKDGFKDVLAAPSSISKSDESSHNVDLPAVVISPAPCTSPSKRVSQHNLIQNLKDVQLRRSKSDSRLTPFTCDILMSQIRKGTQLKPVAQNPMPPIDDDIVAALKDVVQKRHKAIHLSDTEESDLENGDEWND